MKILKGLLKGMNWRETSTTVTSEGRNSELPEINLNYIKEITIKEKDFSDLVCFFF